MPPWGVAAPKATVDALAGLSTQAAPWVLGVTAPRQQGLSGASPKACLRARQSPLVVGDRCGRRHGTFKRAASAPTRPPSSWGQALCTSSLWAGTSVRNGNDRVCLAAESLSHRAWWERQRPAPLSRASRSVLVQVRLGLFPLPSRSPQRRSARRRCSSAALASTSRPRGARPPPSGGYLPP